jgi:predicted GH43/DUF377 family glycosyl hydrolase
MEAITRKRIWAVLVVVGLTLSVWRGVQAVPLAASCQPMGWFPASFGLKDHSVFWYNGYYYLVGIYLPGESFFAYGRSTDLCNWQDLTPVLAGHTPGAWDEQNVWAPFVYEEAGTFYMYYTGVTHAIAQSIMLATTTNPADPSSWQPRGMVFQPKHPNAVWGGFNTWSDCRDPTVVKINGIYYLYYTGLDQAGGIVGIATSNSPLGPWTDWGSILTVSPSAMAESSTITSHGNSYYLFYNDTSQGERFRIGPGPTGPWTQAYVFAPGWAHEVWQGQDGYSYTSFLTDYTVTISRLTWDTLYNPPHPFIGANIYHVLLPLVKH